MARILIVAATREEAGFLSGSLRKAVTGGLYALPGSGKFKADVLITGPGITATTYQLTRVLLQNKYDLAINIGICGSLDPLIKPVRVVNITADQFGDFGAEDGDAWLDAFELGLADKNALPFKAGKLHATFNRKKSCLAALPVTTGITVQSVHGTVASSKKALRKYGPVMESMEGAAFFYVCNMQKVKCLQVRAVSNMVTKRNREQWKVTEALNALAGFVSLLLMEFEDHI